MGRPRKLRPDDGMTVTASPETGEVTNTTFVRDTITGNLGIEMKKKNGKYLPFTGKENLQVGEARYFINGRKLIKVIKVGHGFDKQGNPVYVIKRQMQRTIYRGKKEDQNMIALLIKNKIPGV